MSDKWDLFRNLPIEGKKLIFEDTSYSLQSNKNYVFPTYHYIHNQQLYP